MRNLDQCMLSENDTISKPIFIYYFIRGKMQPIRNLLCYLDIQYVEIFVEKWEEQKHQFCLSLKGILKNLKLKKNLLPLLLHNGLQIYEEYPIAAYLCRYYSREDLLGISIHQRANLQQMLQIFFRKQPSMMKEMFNYAQFAYHHNEKQNKIQIKRRYERVMHESSYIKQICEYLIRQKNPNFIFGDLTLMDFYFLESCHYMCGLCGQITIDSEKQNKPTNYFKNQSSEGVPIEAFMPVLKQFIARMQSLPFYQKHKDYLESYSIIHSLLIEQKIIGLRKIWVGNLNFIK